MTDEKDDISLNLFTSRASDKVPSPSTKRDWITVGFLFALGALVLMLVAYLGFRILAAVLAIITPFIVGLVFALLLDPLVDRMETKMPRVVAVLIVFVVFVSTIVLMAVAGVPALIAQASSLAANGETYIGSSRHVIDLFLRQHPKIWTFHLPKNYNVLSAQVSAQIGAFLTRSVGGATVVLVGSVSTIIDIIVSTIVGIYLLVDIDRIRARIMFLTPERYRVGIAEFGKDVGQVFSDYLRGLVIVCAMYGVTTIVTLYGLAYVPKFGHTGIAQYALLIGAAAGVLYAVPYLGAFITAFVTFVVALATGGLEFGIISILATLIINQTFDNLIAPRVIGGGVGLNPVMALFSLSLGGFLFGFWGLLLSVPIAASIQVVLFRLVPRLTEPTPPIFLEAHGVSPARGKSAQVMGTPPPEVRHETDVRRAAGHEQVQKEVAAENAEAPG